MEGALTNVKKPEPIGWESPAFVPNLPKPQVGEFTQKLNALKEGEILCAVYPEDTPHEVMKQIRVNLMSNAHNIYGSGVVSSALRGKKIYVWKRPVVEEVGPVVFAAVPQENLEREAKPKKHNQYTNPRGAK